MSFRHAGEKFKLMITILNIICTSIKETVKPIENILPELMVQFLAMLELRILPIH